MRRFCSAASSTSRAPAVEAVRRLRRTRASEGLDAYSPHPAPRIDERAGLPRSKVPWWRSSEGCACGGYVLQAYSERSCLPDQRGQPPAARLLDQHPDHLRVRHPARRCSRSSSARSSDSSSSRARTTRSSSRSASRTASLDKFWIERETTDAGRGARASSRVPGSGSAQGPPRRRPRMRRAPPARSMLVLAALRGSPPSSTRWSGSQVPPPSPPTRCTRTAALCAPRPRAPCRASGRRCGRRSPPSATATGSGRRRAIPVAVTERAAAARPVQVRDPLRGLPRPARRRRLAGRVTQMSLRPPPNLAPAAQPRPGAPLPGGHRGLRADGGSVRGRAHRRTIAGRWSPTCERAAASQKATPGGRAAGHPAEAARGDGAMSQATHGHCSRRFQRA